MKKAGCCGAIVEIRDPSGQTLARFIPASGEVFRQRVDWESHSEVAKLACKRMKLRFSLSNAQLFASDFRTLARCWRVDRMHRR